MDLLFGVFSGYSTSDSSSSLDINMQIGAVFLFCSVLTILINTHFPPFKFTVN